MDVSRCIAWLRALPVVAVVAVALAGATATYTILRELGPRCGRACSPRSLSWCSEWPQR